MNAIKAAFLVMYAPRVINGKRMGLRRIHFDAAWDEFKRAWEAAYGR